MDIDKDIVLDVDGRPLSLPDHPFVSFDQLNSEIRLTHVGDEIHVAMVTSHEVTAIYAIVATTATGYNLSRRQ